MALFFANRKHQLKPVTRAGILLIFLALWCGVSYISNPADTETSFKNHKDRKLLSAETVLEHEYEEKQREMEEEEEEEGGTTIRTETITRIEFTGIENNKTVTCIPPAVTQFPRTLFSKSQRQHGALIIHILLATYMFIGLAIVCDEYFVPSLTRVSDTMGLSPDVAGATFMAAGSSAPELATAVIGVFVAKDDIGVSGVVGSAVFNITIVIAVCALVAETPFTLNWYSVCRDCLCYLLSIIVLIFTIGNREVSWPEGLLFIVLYAVYCVAMAFNSKFEAWAIRSLPVPQSWRDAAGTKTGNFEKWDGEGAKPQENGNSDIEMKRNPDGTSDVRLTPDQETKPLREKEVEERDPLKKPLALDDGRMAVINWYVTYPLVFLAVYTIPDCQTKRFERMFVLSFFVSVFWICIYSYLMVWMITVIGFTLGIPDTVMGLTFIAAGVSVPDALSGVAVVKEGHGDMAVSNAIGSNVFDILVCLGVPWFIKTAIVSPGSIVKVTHKGILYSTMTLFSTVVFLIVASHINSWKLDRKFGMILLVWYFVVMVFASLYETNVFGHFNPRECDSNY